ncbi:hypothetical protein A2331_06335 [Candidatus Falkowbacteria bacterium RIFOXYB2_FULL_34_18]|uniref:Uncharacterized protein n=1 Tax=Candidatus Falkowbacteria bacterium RIFOXYD2_FULL_34_120 TaxID=1798007 RepID=A0A1F5TRA9_9BACT|nr:MAG: hypothetical protein A2331_06335 [Candidatus Falkowbacteria bacterium RIFOXYB2_FULL_34_18]OGF29387.1 MAG: hypothetical protein A2500_06425 [Candidatus Falkowbacteria bacterium RIFOXYC12_FULL_34_55]OGF36596.1 MAG: hypothetical protein A2466_06760 [Candidatus Falkowbacteria bacterium RIFOXYC2_FULL_34_220]OGF38814.1 MAG: hypothetical protein A2515_03205 [Candidatus Falkowbacteria bacterium RIFOXYD12_FULL_34_57]OGF41081.1 MAG: hypothetical protein A2531_03290 [Candidatus Falkowbacteria bact
MKKNKLLLTGFLLTFLFSANFVQAANFNPNYIISDAEILDSTSMSLDDVQNFLTTKGGYIKNFKTLNARDELKTAAEIIYDAAVNNYDCSDFDDNGRDFTTAQMKLKCNPIHINPKFLLTLLQKEQSLVEEKSPTQKQLDWATGYGCFDGQACIERYRGFGKQVNSASLQFYSYVTEPQQYTYKAGNTYTISNTDNPPSIVTPSNNATAALYNYTPHVYYGNYNFYNLWIKYFTRKYPNNSLLQVRGEVGVWLIKDGKKRPFLTRGALTSRFNPDKIIQVDKSVLDNYTIGAPIRFPQYSLIRSPKGDIYLLVDDQKRKVSNMEAFRVIGFNPEEVMSASWEDVNSYGNGSEITAESKYPTGALLQNNKTGGVYWVSSGEKAPLIDAIFLKTKFKNKPITQVNPEVLDKYTTTNPIVFEDGELLKSNTSPAVYIIDGNKKRPIVSGEAFEALGYKWGNVITVSPKVLATYNLGNPLKNEFEE